MKIFSMISELGKALLEPVDAPSEIESWQRDPLSHPAVAAMSLCELADLPFSRNAHAVDASSRRR
jgi:hypothetical protein